MKSITVEAKIENVDKVTEFVNEVLEEKECPLKVQMQLDVAIDEIFANPHNAKVIIATDFGVKSSIIGPNLLKATNSFSISFCPMRDPAVSASLKGIPMTTANG